MRRPHQFMSIKDEKRVTEDLSLEPLTDYSKFKALCEDILLLTSLVMVTNFVLQF